MLTMPTDQKELGLFAVALNNADLLDKARAIARQVSERKGSVCIDDVRSDQRLSGLTPSSPNFWGTLFMCKGWACIGSEPSRIKSNNKRRILRWVWRG